MNAIADPRRRLEIPADTANELLARNEWLLTNGLGGYASGTIGGVPTRRYHGLLVAALPNPAGRVMMLSSLGEQLRFLEGPLAQPRRCDLGWVLPQFSTGQSIELASFELELGMPVWRYQVTASRSSAAS